MTFNFFLVFLVASGKNTRLSHSLNPTLSTMAASWTPAARDYVEEKEEHNYEGTSVKVKGKGNPLYEAPKKKKAGGNKKKGGGKKGKKKGGKKGRKKGGLKSEVVVDPLGDAVGVSGSPLTGLDDDPLAVMQKKKDKGADFFASELGKEGTGGALAEAETDGFVPWSDRKAGILATYTTSESLSITTSFLKGQARVPQDTMKARLEELGGDDEIQELANLSQKEYVRHIDTLNKKLVAAWEAEERVKALKIAIQAAKMLSDTSPTRFYPSKFTLVTEILDSFGNLVFERILKKAEAEAGRELGDSFSASDITQMAKETCKNWFYKIASIRELLPRLYVEMAIMRCYQFLTDDAYPDALRRLSRMLRGLGDPLVAVYARTYLTRRGYMVAPGLKDYVISGFSDFLFTCSQISSRNFENDLQARDMTLADYYSLFSPAVDWLLSCITSGSGLNVSALLLEMYEQHQPVAMVLNHVLGCLSPQYISERADKFVRLVGEADETYPKSKLYRALGVNLVLCPPLEQYQLSVLNGVWEVVTLIEDPQEYMDVAEVFIEYPVKHCSIGDVDRMLGDILAHVAGDESRAYEELLPMLGSVVSKIVAHIRDFHALFGMTHFSPLLDLFTGEASVDVCRRVLRAFAKYAPPTFDPVIVNGMFHLGRVVHDSVSALTFDDEIRQISELLVAFVRKVAFGTKFEAHLNFFVECRQAFANLDSVIQALVLGAADLAMKTKELMGGTHNRKTAGFARACLAYCFITVPSIEDVFARLQLYLHCGRVSLMNKAIPQADAFFRTAISIIPEVPHFNERSANVSGTGGWLVAYVKNFASTLVAVPGHPQKGPFYLAKALLSVINNYVWEKNTTHKLMAMTHVLGLFAAHAQENLPYTYEGLEQNARLYGGDPAYGREIQGVIDSIFDLIIQAMGAFGDGDASAKRRQSAAALEIVNVLLAHFDPTPKLCALVMNLFKVAAANTPPSARAYLGNTLEHVRAMVESAREEAEFDEEGVDRVQGLEFLLSQCEAAV